MTTTQKAKAIMTKWRECESYKHKCAKEVLKKWFETGGPDQIWKTNFTQKHKPFLNKPSWIENCELSWKTNRPSGIWLEYPVISNSVQYNWDEIWDENVVGLDFVPTYEQCIENGIHPKRVADLVITHKGSPRYFVEICHKNPVSDEKIEELKALGVDNLIEIDADWIMNQVKMPDILKIKRWLIQDGKIF